ncbi:MAG TPA: hypothetical protein VGP05_04655, partial [Pseudonocardia sp.]|nr:hypothetical protein [Pseudonocardia sp.]
HWRTHLLVPADGRVLRLGPFGGRVPRRGRTLTPAEWQRLRTGAGRPAGRRGVIHALGKAGFPEHLARAASLAPDGHLARVLLGQDVEWPDVPAGFDHDRFNRHLRQQWGAHPGWAKGVYCQTNTKRQALTDLVAALGGFARADQLRAVFPDLGIKNADLLPMTLTRRARNPATADWPPSVERVGQWSAAGKAHEHAVCSILCPGCGQPATAVVRVLEVPGALLCRRCLIAPARPDLRFPPIYATLALPPTAIAPALVTRALATQIGTVTKGRKPRPRQSG